MGMREDLMKRYETSKGSASSTSPSSISETSSNSSSMKDELKSRYEATHKSTKTSNTSSSNQNTTQSVAKATPAQSTFIMDQLSSNRPVFKATNINNNSSALKIQPKANPLTTSKTTDKISEFTGINVNKESSNPVVDGTYKKFVDSGKALSENRVNKANEAYKRYDSNGGNFMSDQFSHSIVGKYVTGESDNLLYMTEGEKNIYNYYLGKGSKDVADSYIERIMPTLQERKSNTYAYNDYQYGKEHPFLGTVESIAKTPLKVASNVFVIGDSKVDGNDDYFGASRSQNALRAGATDDYNGVQKFFYGVGTSTAESFLASLLPGNLGALSLGMSAAADTFQNSAERGGSKAQILANGITAGIAETLFEDFSIGNFKALQSAAVKSGRDIALNTIKSMGVNASEEMATELSNKITDYLSMNDLSEYDTLMKQYITEGMSEEEAKEKTILSLAGDIAMAGLSGAVQGGAMSGAGMGANYIFGSVKGSKIANQDYSEYVEGIDKDSSKDAYEAYKYAVKLADKQSNNEKVSNYQKATMDKLAGQTLSSAKTKTYVSNQSEIDMSERNAVYNNEDVKVGTISKVENGNVFVNVNRQDGSTTSLNVSELNLNDTMAEVYHRASKYGTNSANAFVSSYDGKTSMEYYDTAFKAYNTAGKTGLALDKIQENAPVIDSLTSAMRYAYESGKNDSDTVIPATERVADRFTGLIKNTTSKSVSGAEKGVANLIAKSLGTKIEYASFTGDMADVNGVNTGDKIVLNVRGDKPTMVILSHEITHEFETRAPKEYKALSDYVLNYLQSEHAEEFRKRKESLTQLYKTKGINSDDAINREIVANSTEEFLTSKERISDIIKSDRTIADKFFEIIKNVAAKIEKTLKAYNPKSVEAKLLRKDSEVFNQAVRLWEDAYKATVDNVKTSESTHQYSLKEREALADAFEDIAQTEEEKQKVQNYKENISYIEDKSTQLKAIKSQIKELSFATGTRDKAKIDGLREQAKKLESSINYYDKKLLSLENSKPLKDVMMRDRAQAIAKTNEYYKDQMRSQSSYYQAKLEGQKQHFKDKNEQSKEKRLCSELKSKITKTSIEIGKWLLNGTDKKHVPEGMRFSISNFLESIDFSTDRKNKYGEPTARTLLWLKMKEQYENISNTGSIDSDSEGQYFEIDPDFTSKFSDFISSTEGKKLDNMNSKELQTLHELVSSLKKTITNANKLHIKNRMVEVTDVVDGFFTENRNKKDKKELMGLARATDNLLNFDMLDSFSYFEMLGPTMKNFFHDSIRAGLDKKIRNTKIAEDYIKDLLKDVDPYKDRWTDKKARTQIFEVEGGTIELTPAQVMSLYVQSKREQAKKHIYEGGIKQAPVVVESDVKVGPINVKKTKITKSYQPVTVTESDVARITDTLTDNQKKVAEGIVKFFTTYTSEWGNEVSMELYGYKKFKEENYFPIVSDSNYILTKDGDTTNPIATLKNMGSTKATVKGANNPLIIEDIFDVYARQAAQMGSYNAYVVPLSDLQKIFNTKNTKAKRSFKQELERIYGKAGKEYIHNLMIDINGSAKQGIGTEFSDRAISKMKGASVGANLRVAIQQPTAIVRTIAVMNPKYLAKAVVSKGDFEKAKKYSPIAQWKDWGFFEMDTGRSMREIMLGTHGINAIKEKSMILAAKGDSLTWGKIWKAVEYEIADTTDITKGTEEFYQKCGERFSEIVDKTQVVDSVLHRSQKMRSKDLLVKMSTSFMSEPTKSYNMLKSAYNQIKADRSPQSRKYFGRCALAFTLTSIAASLAAAILDAMRDDDEEEFLEKYSEGFMSNFIDNANPLNMIPFVKEISNMVQGFTPTRTELAGVNDMVTAATNMFNYITGNSTKSFGECMEDVATSFSKLSGLPIKNAVRDTKAIINTAKYIVEDFGVDVGDSYEGIKAKYDINKKDSDGSFNVKVSQQYYGALYQAYKDGDTALYNEIQKDLIKSGRSLDTIKKGLTNCIRRELKENDNIRKMAEAKAKKDATTYYECRSKLTSAGYRVDDINYCVDHYN